MEFASLEEYAEYFCSKRKMTPAQYFIAGYNIAFNAINRQNDFEVWKVCLERILTSKGLMQSFIDEDTREKTGELIRQLTDELFESITKNRDN